MWCEAVAEHDSESWCPTEVLSARLSEGPIRRDGGVVCGRVRHIGDGLIMKCVVFKDSASEWRWKIVARNGEIIATCGEGFTRRAHALSMARKLSGVDVMVLVSNSVTMALGSLTAEMNASRQLDRAGGVEEASAGAMVRTTFPLQRYPRRVWSSNSLSAVSHIGCATSADTRQSSLRISLRDHSTRRGV